MLLGGPGLLSLKAVAPARTLCEAHWGTAATSAVVSGACGRGGERGAAPGGWTWGGLAGWRKPVTAKLSGDCKFKRPRRAVPAILRVILTIALCKKLGFTSFAKLLGSHWNGLRPISEVYLYFQGQPTHFLSFKTDCGCW